MMTNAMEILYKTLFISKTTCGDLKEYLKLAEKVIKQTEKYLGQLNALSLPAVESCSLSSIPGYLPKLRGCVAGKITDNIIQWKDIRHVVCGLASEVVKCCCEADSAHRAAGAALPPDPDPCVPRPGVLLETVHDCRHSFGQLLHLLQEEEDVSVAPDDEIANIREDLVEMKTILDVIEERLQLCAHVTSTWEEETCSVR